MIERTELIALGPCQMSHVWMAVFANGAARVQNQGTQRTLDQVKKVPRDRTNQGQNQDEASMAATSASRQ